MTHNVSESIIDSLTDVKMPHYAPLAQVSGSIDLNGTILPEYRCNTLVLGSGAAASCRRAETAKCRCNGSLQQSLLGNFRLFWF